MFPHSEEVRDVPLIILAASAYVIAAIVWLIADRLRDWHIHAVLASGTAIISLANYYAGPGTLYPILYTWTALYAFYFFPIREAAAQMVFLGPRTRSCSRSRTRTWSSFAGCSRWAPRSSPAS